MEDAWEHDKFEDVALSEGGWEHDKFKERHTNKMKLVKGSQGWSLRPVRKGKNKDGRGLRVFAKSGHDGGVRPIARRNQTRAVMLYIMSVKAGLAGKHTPVRARMPLGYKGRGNPIYVCTSCRRHSRTLNELASLNCGPIHTAKESY